MKITNDGAIDELKSVLTRQLEAYLQSDWQSYEELEKKLLLLEKEL